MSIFDEVKAVATMQQVADMFGLKPNRAGFISCPFHQEKTASMKLYEKSFYCFGCHTGGDVISFTARMLNTSNIEGAKYLAGRLGLSIDDKPSIEVYMAKKKREEEKKQQELFNSKVKRAEDLLCDYHAILNKAQGDVDNPLFVESCDYLELVSFYLDLLRDGPEYFLQQYSKEVEIVARRVDKLNNT